MVGRRSGHCLVALVIAVLWQAGPALGVGFVLGKTKEELKLEYDVAITDHGTGRVTIVLTLSSEGNMKPLDEVQFVIPSEKKSKRGPNYVDFLVSIDMKSNDDGTKTGRIHLQKDLAQRSEIWLNTHTLDGKVQPLTRYHHVISMAKHLSEKQPPVETNPPVAQDESAEPPASQR